MSRSVYRAMMRRDRERRENAGHSGVYADQFDPLHAVVYSTERDTYKLPRPHAPQQVTLGDDPHATVTASPATTDAIADFLRRYLP